MTYQVGVPWQRQHPEPRRPEQPVLAAIAELEALESPDEIDRTVLWQLEEGRRRGEGQPESISIPLFPPGVDLDEVLADLEALRGRMRRLRGADAPYRDGIYPEPGDRVGWVDADGVVHVELFGVSPSSAVRAQDALSAALDVLGRIGAID